MPEQSTETEPLPSNEGDYLKLANDLKSQFDEQKAKWEAKFKILEQQNKTMKNFIKRINNVTSEIVKSNNKRMFDEIDNGAGSSSESPRRRTRRRIHSNVVIGRTDGREMTEGERQLLRFMIENIPVENTEVSEDS